MFAIDRNRFQHLLSRSWNAIVGRGAVIWSKVEATLQLRFIKISLNMCTVRNGNQGQ